MKRSEAFLWESICKKHCKKHSKKHRNIIFCSIINFMKYAVNNYCKLSLLLHIMERATVTLYFVNYCKDVLPKTLKDVSPKNEDVCKQTSKVQRAGRRCKGNIAYL